MCRRFGILTHHLAPIEEALRGAGLELEWSGAVHGGKSVPSAQATAMCGAAVLVVACRPVAGAAARCRWRMAAANPSRMSVGFFFHPGAMNGYTLDDGATSVGYRGYVWRRN